jgi:sigma-B regulation protein RsbU (phosphoserine phosphatase)
MPKRLRVLLVEGKPSEAELLLQALKQSRSPSFVVIHETALADAIGRIEVSAAFDVALVDLDLPDSTGVETLRRVQAAEPSLPIVVTTDDGDPSFADQALKAGAQDCLVKTEASERLVVRSVLHAISRKEADLERKAAADGLAYSLAAQCERMDEDQSLARAMQFDLLPRRGRLDGFLQSHGLAVDGYFEPSFDIGGDLWGCAEGVGPRAIFYTFDFSGHGVGAALNVFRLHALLSELEGAIVDPAATLGRLNSTLHGLLPRGQYATIFLAVIDTAENTLTWAAGGAPRPIYLDGEGGASLLDTRGKPLGILASARYVNRVMPFPPKSSLFLYSDVMTESMVPGNDMLDEDGLLNMVREFHGVRGIDIPGLIGRFTDTVGSPMNDDMTAVCITRIADGKKSGHDAAGSRQTRPAAHGAGTVPPTGPAPLILTSTHPEAIAAGLSLPYCGFLEIGSAGLGDVGRECFEAVERGGLCLSLTAASACSYGMTNLLGAAIRRRFDGDRDWDGIDLCLSEAIGNAIIHGSLGVTSSLRETRAGLDQFSEAVHLGLKDTASAGKRVEVTVVPLPDARLELTVYDQGTGFDFDRCLNEAVLRDAKHGRGLALIRKLAHSVASRQGGRALVIVI